MSASPSPPACGLFHWRYEREQRTESSGGGPGRRRHRGSGGSVRGRLPRHVSVTQAAELRTKLTEADATLHVVKNTLTERAADKAGAEALKELLEGPTALTFVRGDVATGGQGDRARSGATNEVPQFKGGTMDGERAVDRAARGDRASCRRATCCTASSSACSRRRSPAWCAAWRADRRARDPARRDPRPGAGRAGTQPAPTPSRGAGCRRGTGRRRGARPLRPRPEAPAARPRRPPPRRHLKKSRPRHRAIRSPRRKRLKKTRRPPRARRNRRASHAYD